MSKNVTKMDSWSKDLLAALLVGVIAGPLSIVVVNNLGVTLPFGIPTYALAILFPILTVVGIVVARLAGKFWGTIYKFGKFGEVGGLNWLVDLGVFNLLIAVSGAAGGAVTVVYKAISFSVAVVNSYFWNRGWVFSDAQKQDQTKEAGKFLIASLLGLGFNAILYSVIKFGGQAFAPGISDIMWANIAAICGSLSAMVFNFILYKIWVFKD